MRVSSSLFPLTVLLLSTSLGACAAAAGAAAGAAGAIAYTERGASTEIDATVEDVAAATESVFADLGVVVTGRAMEDSGRSVRIEGSRDETEISVEIEREDEGLTEVEVIAQEGTLDYDPDQAHDILERLLARL